MMIGCNNNFVVFLSLKENTSSKIPEKYALLKTRLRLWRSAKMLQNMLSLFIPILIGMLKRKQMWIIQVAATCTPKSATVLGSTSITQKMD